MTTQSTPPPDLDRNYNYLKDFLRSLTPGQRLVILQLLEDLALAIGGKPCS